MADLDKLKQKIKAKKFRQALTTGATMTVEEVYGTGEEALEKYLEDTLGPPRIPLVFTDPDTGKVHILGEVEELKDIK